MLVFLVELVSSDKADNFAIHWEWGNDEQCDTVSSVHDANSWILHRKKKQLFHTFLYETAAFPGDGVIFSWKFALIIVTFQEVLTSMMPVSV